MTRTLVLLAACGGFVVGLALTSSADVVEPSSAYQPASTSLLAEEADTGASVRLPAEKVATSAPPQTPPLAETRQEVVPATPAPEVEVRPAPARVKRAEPVSAVESVLGSVARPLGAGFERVGLYLDRVVSACQVAASSGAGVPVLALAVLSMVAAVDRRRIFGMRSATDEDVPELLYATEVIAPG